MSQSLPLPSSTKAYTTVSQLLDSVVPGVPEDAKSGYFYKKTANDGLFWKTLGAGEINLIAPSSISSFGTATSIEDGTVPLTAPSCTKAGISALAATGAATVTGANTAVGSYALMSLPDNDDYASSQTAFGYAAGKTLRAGRESVIIGANACPLIASVTGDVVIGYNALLNATTDSFGSNVLIGALVASDASTFSGSENVGIGYRALFALTSGAANVCLGLNAGAGLTTGSHNIFVGLQAGLATTTANNNVAIGESTLANNITGTNNTVVGHSGLPNATGGSNSTLGFQTGAALTTGTNNVIIGSNANVTSGSNSNSIVIGTSSRCTGGNEIRIGFDGTQSAVQTKCFIDGVRGITTVNTDAIAVLVDSKGQHGTVSSSQRYKHDIHDMNSSVIDSIFNMRPVDFIYNEDVSNTVTYGLIAEEVEKIRPDIIVYERNNDGSFQLDDYGKKIPMTIQYHLLVPMLIGCVKELKAEISDLRSMITV